MRPASLAVAALALLLGGCGDSSEAAKAPPTRPPPDVERAVRAATRPLTAKDVEDYIALEPFARAARVGTLDMAPLFEKRGVDPREWQTVRVRIAMAYQSVKTRPRPPPGGEADSPDDAVVRPFAARIEEALRPR